MSESIIVFMAVTAICVAIPFFTYIYFVCITVKFDIDSMQNKEKEMLLDLVTEMIDSSQQFENVWMLRKLYKYKNRIQKSINTEKRWQ